MSITKNVALSSCYNYEWNKIEVVIRSYRNVCPNDDMVMFFYSMPSQYTISMTEKYNVMPVLVKSSRPDRIVVERFLAYSSFLAQNNYDYSVCVDASDIYFQLDPFAWMQKNLNDKKCVVASEQILIRDEVWNRGNIIESFPEFYENVKDFEVINAGSFGGKASYLSELCRKVYDMSHPNPVFNPDQAALNVHVRMNDPDSFLITHPEDGWSCQCMITANDTRGDHPDFMYNKYLIGNKPSVTNSKIVSKDEKVLCLAHQYSHSKMMNNVVLESLKIMP